MGLPTWRCEQLLPPPVQLGALHSPGHLVPTGPATLASDQVSHWLSYNGQVSLATLARSHWLHWPGLVLTGPATLATMARSLEESTTLVHIRVVRCTMPQYCCSVVGPIYPVYWPGVVFATSDLQPVACISDLVPATSRLPSATLALYFPPWLRPGCAIPRPGAATLAQDQATLAQDQTTLAQDQTTQAQDQTTLLH